MGQIGKTAFISYRGRYVHESEVLQQALLNGGLYDRVVRFPPNSLCEENEILLPYEYIELMGFILDYLSQCDGFIFLSSEDYIDSYWTQAEVLQWRRFRDQPVVIPSVVIDGQPQLGQPQMLAEMTHNEKHLWAGISVSVERRYKGHLNPRLACGKFAKNCFLVSCRVCGEHFLVTQKYAYQCVRGEASLSCPHCGASGYTFTELQKQGNFYRKPITVTQSHPTGKPHPIRVLESDEILDLLLENTLPETIKIVPDDAEHQITSDMGKIGRFMLGGAALLGAALIVGLLGDDSE
ncbi:MAG: hypothetical protein IT320_07800 [Anaerolineae bacterium]|nr:hypothetical protein [Anaerolineae bacterium]